MCKMCDALSSLKAQLWWLLVTVAPALWAEERMDEGEGFLESRQLGGFYRGPPRRLGRALTGVIKNDVVATARIAGDGCRKGELNWCSALDDDVVDRLEECCC